MDFSIIKNDLEKLIEDLKSLLTDDDIRNLTELINHGEYGVAVELICTQLFEYEVVIDEKILQRIKKAGVAMSLSEEIWNVLEVK